MNKTYQKSFPGEKNAGFTLIELLVVVLIIGILAAVALPQYQRAVMKARYTKAIIWTKAVKDAFELYYLANGAYPSNFDDVDINVPTLQLAKGQSFLRVVEGGKQIGAIWYFSSGGGMLEMEFKSDPVFGELQYYMMLDHSQYPGERYCGFYGNTSEAKRAAATGFCKGMGGTPAPKIPGYSSLHKRFLLP